MPKRIARCEVPTCTTVARVTRGFCPKHYTRWLRHGDVSIAGPYTPASVRAPKGTPLIDRLFMRIDKRPDGCWIWTGQRRTNGYGFLAISSAERDYAHRISYRLHVGPIPDGTEIDHLCRVRACVNPTHLEPVTHRENMLRSPISLATINSAKTHCPHGHEYTPENTMVRLPKPGRRAINRCCRTCYRIRDARRQSVAS